jgi:hypothetical protein
LTLMGQTSEILAQVASRLVLELSLANSSAMKLSYHAARSIG